MPYGSIPPLDETLRQQKERQTAITYLYEIMKLLGQWKVARVLAGQEKGKEKEK